MFVEDADHVMWMPGQVQAAVEAEKEFMRMLDLTVDKVGLRPTANNYAPKVFSDDVRCRMRGRAGKKKLTEAMDRLVTKGTIATQEYGPPSNRHERIIRAPVDAGEGGKMIPVRTCPHTCPHGSSNGFTYAGKEQPRNAHGCADFQLPACLPAPPACHPPYPP